MEQFASRLNNLLVDTFKHILKVEEESIKRSEKLNLTISEMHLIESVGKGEGKGRKISELAEDLCITLPSVTVAINKLVKKGYVEKVPSTTDKRVVYVVLTELGEKTQAVHRYFHESMVRSVTEELTEEEKDAMYKGIEKLNTFFKKRLRILEET